MHLGKAVGVGYAVGMVEVREVHLQQPHTCCTLAKPTVASCGPSMPCCCPGACDDGHAG
jgi:hypothetical protein